MLRQVFFKIICVTTRILHILLHSLQKQRCGKVGINSVIFGNCGKKSEWKLVQNAAGDLALCPSYTLLSEKWVNAHLVQDFLKNEGFTLPFAEKKPKQ